ncbi:MAG: hypothetical protein RBG13Loki_4122 [Promethearchaeota archaeon CR_4]|nr:MAG: hypothetical protein RBG13Loki_4122 [Candidatus Lokiarchaeota archaeon CR_4]
MPNTKNIIIQHFSDRFLNLEEGKEVSSIAAILDLPIRYLKEASAQDIESLGKFNIKTIRDLSQFKPEKAESQAVQYNIDLGKLKKFLIAGKLISRAWQKRSSYGKKTTMKIVVVGLDNAGKTTLIDLLSGKKLSEVINQTPTTMVNQVNLPSQDMNLVAWDFGGQTQHREAYLQTPEEYFLGLDLVIFVIDTQDSPRYEESIGYFTQLLDIIVYLKENPYFLVLLHKSDPELLENPEFQINLEYLDGKIHDFMAKTKFGLEIVKSSIYSTFTAQPQIVGALKDMFKSNQVTDVNVMLLDAMMKLTDMMTQIGNKMVQMQEQIQLQLEHLVRSPQKSVEISAIPSLHPEKPPKSLKTGPTPPSVPQELPKLESSVKEIPGRTEIMSELKELFKKKGLTKIED